MVDISSDKLHSEELGDLCSSSNGPTVRILISRRL